MNQVTIAPRGCEEMFCRQEVETVRVNDAADLLLFQLMFADSEHAAMMEEYSAFTLNLLIKMSSSLSLSLGDGGTHSMPPS